MITIEQYAEEHPAVVRHDLDAVNNGWDPWVYPEDSRLYNLYVGFTGIDPDGDEAMELLDCVGEVLQSLYEGDE